MFSLNLWAEIILNLRSKELKKSYEVKYFITYKGIKRNFYRISISKNKCLNYRFAFKRLTTPQKYESLKFCILN